MKYLVYFILITSTLIAQPNPMNGYPERISEITKMLEKDALNYELIWERLQLQVSLLDGAWIYNPFYTYPALEQNTEKLRVKEYESDFDKIYTNIIRPNNFVFVEEKKFYSCRGLYYSKTRQFDHALDDFKHLLDLSIESKENNSEHYTFHALDMLFNIYVFKNEYKQALKTIDLKLDQEKKTSVKRYFSHANSAYLKVKLLDKYGQKNEIISYLKQLSRAYFAYYFKNISNAEINLNNVKLRGYECLGQLVKYMTEFDHAQKQKYREIHNKLTKNNYLNPDLQLNDLKAIVKKI